MLWNHLENFENVIWDWNGTLLDDHHAAWKAECRLFEHIGHTGVDVLERKKIFTMPVRAYYEKLGLDFSKLNYEEIASIWFGHYVEEVKLVTLFAGTRELLERIWREKKKQFILSAAPEKHLVEYMAANDLAKYFHGVYGLKSNVADCKRERGRDLFREHHIEPEKTLIIGDMVHDAEVAETLGCHVLLVADGHQDYELLKNAELNAGRKKVLKSRFPQE